MSMYTDPDHIKVSDPGKVEGNIVFTYLDVFANDNHFKKYLPEYNNLDELKEKYKHGGLGDMVIKKFLFNILNELLSTIREERSKWITKLPDIMTILENGNKIANEVANNTLMEVKKAMGIDYFEDKNFINEQIEKYNN